MSPVCITSCENLIDRKHLTEGQTRKAENDTVLLIGKGKLKEEVTVIMCLIFRDESVIPEVYDRCIYMQTRFHTAEYT